MIENTRTSGLDCWLQEFCWLGLAFADYFITCTGKIFWTIAIVHCNEMSANEIKHTDNTYNPTYIFPNHCSMCLS